MALSDKQKRALKDAALILTAAFAEAYLGLMEMAWAWLETLM